MKLELKEGESLEVSDDTPMYNSHILPLKHLNMILNSNFKKEHALPP